MSEIKLIYLFLGKKKKSNIKENTSKIKDNIDWPKVTLKSTAERNYFESHLFLIFTVFLK